MVSCIGSLPSSGITVPVRGVSRVAWCRRRRSEDTPPPSAASYVEASSNWGCEYTPWLENTTRFFFWLPVAGVVSRMTIIPLPSGTVREEFRSPMTSMTEPLPFSDLALNTYSAPGSSSGTCSSSNP